MIDWLWSPLLSDSVCISFGYLTICTINNTLIMDKIREIMNTIIRKWNWFIYRYSSVLAEWNQQVKVLVRVGGANSAANQTLCLKLKHGLTTDTIKWILCKRLDISEKSLLVFRDKDGGKHIQQLSYYMDHLVVDHLATPTTPPPSLYTTNAPQLNSKWVSMLVCTI